MKINFLKKTVFATMLLAGLALTSCKGKTDEGDDKGSDDTEVSTDTVSSENTNATPADTVVTKNDTVVEMGTKLDSKENATGTQVP